jgi:hypothetical protein
LRFFIFLHRKPMFDAPARSGRYRRLAVIAGLAERYAGVPANAATVSIMDPALPLAAHFVHRFFSTNSFLF